MPIEPNQNRVNYGEKHKEIKIDPKFFEEIRKEIENLPQKKVGIYIRCQKITYKNNRFFFTMLKQGIYSKNPKERKEAWAIINTMKKEGRDAFVKEIKTEEKSYKAQQTQKAKKTKKIK